MEYYIAKKELPAWHDSYIENSEELIQLPCLSCNSDHEDFDDLTEDGSYSDSTGAYVIKNDSATYWRSISLLSTPNYHWGSLYSNQGPILLGTFAQSSPHSTQIRYVPNTTTSVKLRITRASKQITITKVSGSCYTDGSTYVGENRTISAENIYGLLLFLQAAGGSGGYAPSNSSGKDSGGGAGGAGVLVWLDFTASSSYEISIPGATPGQISTDTSAQNGGNLTICPVINGAGSTEDVLTVYGGKGAHRTAAGGGTTYAYEKKGTPRVRVIARKAEDGSLVEGYRSLAGGAGSGGTSHTGHYWALQKDTISDFSCVDAVSFSWPSVGYGAQRDSAGGGGSSLVGKGGNAEIDERNLYANFGSGGGGRNTGSLISGGNGLSGAPGGVIIWVG